MIGFALSLVLSSASFPLPTVDGKPLAVARDQRVFRLPMRFEKVKTFYEDQFAGDAQHPIKHAGASGNRTITLTSKRPTDAWKKAVIKEASLETTIELTPVMRMDDEGVEGRGTPLVEFIIGRSKEVDAALNSIDHMKR